MSPLRDHIARIVPLSEKEFGLVLGNFTHRVVRKNQYLLQEGDVCTSEYYVLSGTIRQYYLHDGKERITQFGFADYWVSDWWSMLHQTPSKFNIDALERSEVLEIEKKSLDIIFEEVPKFEKVFRVMFQRAFAAQQQRISYMQKPGEESYHDFATMYGHFEQRVSQTHIASFLGITRESLSRIKHQSLRKQKK